MPLVVSFNDSLPTADSYRPDPAKVLSGDPLQTVSNAFSSTDGRFNCGIWTAQIGTWSVFFTENEFCHLLEGKIVITDNIGNARTFTAGDAFVIPAGFVGTWQVLEPARKLYAVYE